MKKLSFTEISCLLDSEDIKYLSRLLFTIETVPELRSRIIPQENVRDGKSNFVRVEYKITQIAKYFRLNQTISILSPPENPLKKSRLKNPKTR